MADVPNYSGRRFHTSDSGDLRHNSIHDRTSNHSSSHRDSDSDDEQRPPLTPPQPQQQQQQQQQHPTPTLSLQKPPMLPGNEAPLVAVQVVDRLRWWRTRRVREQPLPLHHYVFRGNYTNYSSFGTRPLAPAVTRLLQKAREVRAQHQRYQQFLHRQQMRQRGMSATSSTVDEGERRLLLLSQQQSQQQQQQGQHEEEPQPPQEAGLLSREESDLLDNKRVTNTSNPAAGSSAAAPLASPPSSPPHRAADNAEAHTPHRVASPVDLASAAAPATAVPPLSIAAIGGSSLGSASLTSVVCPTDQELKEAEQLLRLYQPRAASVPVRSRRQRRLAGYGPGVTGPADQHHNHQIHHNSHHNTVEERGSQSMHLTRVPTSDDMTEVCGAAGAADSAVVLHHEPRLVIYERDMNPRTALRKARVSSEALEGLRDAAAESSSEVFALANLPLSGFERFFYQQQLRDGRLGDEALAELPPATQTSDAAQGGHAEPHTSANTARTTATNTPAAAGEFPSAPLTQGNGVDVDVYPPGYGVVNREDALYFGSPLTITSPAFSPQTRTPASTTTANAPGARPQLQIQAPPSPTPHNVHHYHSGVEGGSAAERLHDTAILSQGQRGRGRRAAQKWSALRAVSVPCLPRVYRGGCPQLHAPDVSSSSLAAPVVQDADMEEKRATITATTNANGHRSRGGQHQHHHHRRRHLLPPALRSSARAMDGAHLCHRVDDLQDVYAFNPIFDAIGKGAFSKVYAAVPILRGRDGMKRFRALEDAELAPDTRVEAATTTTTHALRKTDGKKVAAATTSAAPLTSLLSMSATPTNSPPASFDLHTEAAAAAAATTSTAHRTSVRSVPVVALKVIPRKARQKEQKAAVGSPTSLEPSQQQQQQQEQQQQQHADPNNSVRRELVEIEREVSILRRLHHTGCSHFYEALRSPDAFVIAMRVYPGSMDARHYLSRYGSPSEVRTALVLFQLVSTVNYLHSYFGLIHRDIKLENLLFSEVDSAVSNTRISEVLGNTVHKADLAAAEDDLFAERPSPGEGVDGGMEGQGGGTASKSAAAAAAKAHEVKRLLRVTLIDFGLARRTRSAGMSAANLSRVRGNPTRTQSLSASMNSPANVLSGFAASPHPSVGAGGGNGGGAFNLTSPTVPTTGATLSSLVTPTCSGTAAAVSQQSQPPQQQSQFSSLPQLTMPTVNNTSVSATPSPTATAAAAGGLGAFMTTRSANNSYTAMPAVPPPLRPPRLCRSPSSAAHGATGSTAAGAPWLNPSASRMGMPSPMPSTANMFTRFLDLDEDLDEEESVANGASTTGFAGGARAYSEMMTSGAYEASLTSPYAASSFRRRGSRTGFPEEESAASSTDVSASETDSDADHDGDDETGDVLARSGTASGGDDTDTEPATAGTAAAASLTPIVQIASEPNIATPTRLVQPLPSPHTPMRLSSDGSSQTMMGGVGGGTSAANTPPTLYHRLPPSQNFFAFRDDTEAPLLLTPCGTEKYLPPEVLSWVLERGWTRRSTTVGLARAMDMYAIGIVAYVLLSGCFPFNASSRATLLQQQQRVPRCNSTRWAGVSSEAIAFVQRLLEPNPLKRMTAKEALEHPFLLEARQLAEKLSLVPHGEGEELPPRTSEEVSAAEALMGGRFPGAGASTGTTNNNNNNANTVNPNVGTHGLMSGSNSLRAHWSPLTGPRAGPPPSSPSLSTAAGVAMERARAMEGPTSSMNVAAGTTSYHRTSSLASPVRCGTQPSFAVPGRAAFSRASTPDTSFGPLTGAAPPPPVPLQRKGTTQSNASGNALRDGADGGFLQSADSASHDMFAAMARDVLGSGRPPRRETLQPPPSPQQQQQQRQQGTGCDTHADGQLGRASSSPRQSSSPLLSPAARAPPLPPLTAATAAAAKPAGDVLLSPSAALAASAKATEAPPLRCAPAASSKPSSTPAPAPPPSSSAPALAAKRGGDDLFESLYNNIMFDD